MMSEATIDRIAKNAHRQRAIIEALMKADKELPPVTLAEMTGLKQANIRQAVIQMKENGLLIQPDDGLYALPEWASRYPSLNNDSDDAALAKRKADARRNAGIVVRDTNSGSVWFRIPFPDYMVVETPMVVRIEADANDPNMEKLREHFTRSEP